MRTALIFVATAPLTAELAFTASAGAETATDPR
jgi:hypothetical protein